MIIPPVNIVLSEDFELMKTFSETGSLEKFRAEVLSRGDDVLFLTNSLNSNFLSLEHAYNTEKEGAFLTLEFIDPSYNIEEGVSVDLDYSMISNVEDINIKERAAKKVLEARRLDPRKYEAGSEEYNQLVEDARLLGAKYNQALDYINKGHKLDLDELEDYKRRGYGGSRYKDFKKSVKKKLKYAKKIVAEGGKHKRAWQIVSMMRDQETGRRLRIQKQVKGLMDPFGNLNEEAVDDANVRLRRLALGEGMKKGIFHRPIYVAYGLGDDIRRNWCSPQCFGRPIRAEYSFTGEGARVIKLIFGGKEVAGAVLSRLGLSPLGKEEKPIGYTGISDTLFDPIVNQRRRDSISMLYRKRHAPISVFPGIKELNMLGDSPWSDNIGEAVNPIIPKGEKNRLWTPSMHIAFKTCMTNYLETAVDNEYKGNIVVWFPNIDKYAVNAWVSKFEEAWGWGKTLPPNEWVAAPQKDTDFPNRIYDGELLSPKDPVGGIVGDTRTSLVEGWEGDKFWSRWYGAWVRLANSLGLEVINLNDSDQAAVSILEASHVALQFSDKNISAYWNNKNLVLSCHNNFYTPFIDKLKNVGSALSDAFDNNEENSISIKPRLMIETEQVVLTAMKQAGLILHDDRPAIIWGDYALKRKYLDAAVVERSQSTTPVGGMNPESGIAAALSNATDLHLTDQLLITKEYLKTITDYLNPAPYPGAMSWMGLNSQKINMLNSDPNISDTYSNFSSKNPLATRSPIFTFGVADPNVLKVKLDIDNMYTGILSSSTGKRLANQIVATNYAFADIDPDDLREMSGFLLKIGQWNAEDPENPPEQFKKFADLFYTYDEQRKSLEKGMEESGTHVLGDITGPTHFGKWTSPLQKNKLLKPLVSSLRNQPIKPLTLRQQFAAQMGWGVDVEADKEAYYKIMWSAFLRLYENTKDTLPFNTGHVKHGGKGNIAQNIKHTTRATDRLLAHSLVGRINVLPMFNLSSDRSVMDRPCIIYGVEPRFINASQDPGESQSAWFSGVYKMHGWKHSIGQNEASSEFYVHRDTRYVGK